MNSKQLAAEHAVQFIKDGMTVGLGTGSTSAFAIDAIGKKVQQGLSINAVASSLRSEEQAQSLGITLLPFSEVQTIDVYIDGADEVDRDLHLIKGGGGALLRGCGEFSKRNGRDHDELARRAGLRHSGSGRRGPSRAVKCG